MLPTEGLRVGCSFPPDEHATHTAVLKQRRNHLAHGRSMPDLWSSAAGSVAATPGTYRPTSIDRSLPVIRYVIYTVIQEVIIMSTADAHPDLAAFNDVTRMSDAQLVSGLRELLGAKLVAYLGAVKEVRAVRQWADGSRSISGDTDRERLRIAYRAARLITERDAPTVAQAWFQGLNPALDDVSPARLLRETDLESSGPAVLGAARQFAAVG